MERNMQINFIWLKESTANIVRLFHGKWKPFERTKDGYYILRGRLSRNWLHLWRWCQKYVNWYNFNRHETCNKNTVSSPMSFYSCNKALQFNMLYRLPSIKQNLLHPTGNWVDPNWYNFKMCIVICMHAFVCVGSTRSLVRNKFFFW